MKLNERIKEVMDSIEFQTKEIKGLLGEENLQLLVLDVVSSISVDKEYVSFWINTESDRDEQRKFINQVARIYKVKMSKEKSYWKSSLNCEGTTPEGRTINIYGYVPPTCQLVETEEDLKDYEIEQAQKQIEKAQALLAAGKKVVKQVVCQ